MDEPRPTYLSQTDPEHDRRRRRIALVVVLVILAVSVIGIGVANNSYQRCKGRPPRTAERSRSRFPTVPPARTSSRRSPIKV